MVGDLGEAEKAPDEELVLKSEIIDDANKGVSENGAIEERKKLDLYTYKLAGIIKSKHESLISLINENGELIISGNWIGDEIPSHPNWMRFTKEEGNFIISVSAKSFFLEIITLLFEVYNSRERNKENKLPTLLTEALLNLRNRWRSPGEPIVPREQMRLIGELIPVIETSSIIGKEAIESWDSDGRALHDITSDRWVIECKATSKSPESVWISDPAQLDHRIDKNVFLSVTRMNRDKDGKTFPEMINELLIGIQSEEDKRAIKVMLNTTDIS